MARLVRYADSARRCWSRVNLDSGEPIFIGISRRGVIVKRSRLGIMGAVVYEESNRRKAAGTAMAVDAEVREYITPSRMRNRVLRAFTQAALESSSATELSIRLSKAQSRPE